MSSGFEFVLLEENPEQSGNSYIEQLKIVLKLVGKLLSNVVTIAGYNCSTNKLVARNVERGFAWSTNHCSNLVVQDHSSKEENNVNVVSQTMAKM